MDFIKNKKLLEYDARITMLLRTLINNWLKDRIVSMTKLIIQFQSISIQMDNFFFLNSEGAGELEPNHPIIQDIQQTKAAFDEVLLTNSSLKIKLKQMELHKKENSNLPTFVANKQKIKNKLIRNMRKTFYNFYIRELPTLQNVAKNTYTPPIDENLPALYELAHEL